MDSQDYFLTNFSVASGALPNQNKSVCMFLGIYTGIHFHIPIRKFVQDYDNNLWHGSHLKLQDDL